MCFLFVCLFETHLSPPQRPAAEQKELTNKWNEMGTDEPGLWRHYPGALAPEQSGFYERLVLMCGANCGITQTPGVLNGGGLTHLCMGSASFRVYVRGLYFILGGFST